VSSYWLVGRGGSNVGVEPPYPHGSNGAPSQSPPKNFQPSMKRRKKKRRRRKKKK